MRAGEIVGVAGLEGNGQSELVLAIARLLRASGGTLFAAPLCHIPEDRLLRGLVLDFSVEDNLILWSPRLKHVTLRGPIGEILINADPDMDSPEPLLQTFAEVGSRKRKQHVVDERDRRRGTFDVEDNRVDTARAKVDRHALAAGRVGGK